MHPIPKPFYCLTNRFGYEIKNYPTKILMPIYAITTIHPNIYHQHTGMTINASLVPSNQYTFLHTGI